MKTLEENYDIVVVGAGHAGCEGSTCRRKTGARYHYVYSQCREYCTDARNPNVGGSSKGHLVRELDALGGEMGKNIDKTFIQSKM